MAPGMRLGWLRAPAALLRPCVIAKQAADLHTSTVDQAAAARYLADCDLDAHLGRVRSAYRARRDALLAGCPRRFRPAARGIGPRAGCSSGYGCPRPGRHRAAAYRDHARRRLRAGRPLLAAAPDPATLRMSFTTHTPEEIAEGLRRLAPAFG